MKKSLLFILALVLVPMLSQAQDGEWTFAGNFPDDTTFIGGAAGVAVDGEGKIWMHDYYFTDGVIHLRVFDEEGIEVDFSPVTGVNINDDSTAFNAPGTALESSPSGDIYFGFGETLVRIDHQTGEGLSRAFTGGNIAGPAVDSFGNIYVTYVVGGAVRMYDADLDTTEGNGEILVETTSSVHRDFAVSRDGNNIYLPHDGNMALLHYSRPSDLGDFGEPDTVIEGMTIESVTIDPHNGDVWFSKQDADAGHVWYGYNPETWEQVDSVAWQESEDYELANQLPRAAAFDRIGNTLYIGAFKHDDPAFPPIQKFTRNEPVSNEPVTELPEGYTLEQNYPNPFNPTTNINYTIQQAGDVSLKVYDITGREIATLVNSRMSAGEHTATFDASNLASGVYIYALETNGLKLTNKMTLIK